MSTGSLRTPRGSTVEGSAALIGQYDVVEVEVRVQRGGERLGMELNAYNQVLSFVPGSPTDRNPHIVLQDRVVVVDGVALSDGIMLTDVLVPRDEHVFIVERWVPPASLEPSKRLSPRTLENLGKARANGADPAEAAAVAAKARAAKKAKKAKAEAALPGFERFTVTIRRGVNGLGLVCDEEGVVVDMVPGSDADV